MKIVAVSNFARSMLEESSLRVQGVVHHGVDLDVRSVDRSFLHVVEESVAGRLMALTIGGNNARKGLDRLLHAYRLVEEGVANSFLVLHSEPKKYYDERMKIFQEKYCDLPALATELGIQRAWLTNSYGRLKTSEVRALYKLCSIYVMPSFAEGFGLPMIEAFRFNKPVIAVDAPPFNEVVEDGETGILIPYEKVQWFNYKNRINFKMHIYEPRVLAEAIIKLLSNDRLRTEMQTNVKEKKNKWSIGALYPKLLDYF